MRYPHWRSVFLSCFLGVTVGSGLLPLSSALVRVQASELGSQNPQDGVIKTCTGQRIDLGAPQLTDVDLKRLTRCSSEVMPQLLEALNAQDWKVKVIAAYTLGLFGIRAQAAIPALSNLIQDENADVRFVAAQALGKIGTTAVIPALTQALQDKDENVRVSAAVAFQRIGRVAKQAKPALIAALWDGNWYVRSRAAATISKLGLEESDIPDLLEPWRNGGLLNKRAIVNEGAIVSLMIAIDPYVRKRVQDVPVFFIKALQNKDSKVRESAAIALGEIGLTTPGSTQFLYIANALLKTLDDPDVKVRKSAIEALGFVLSGLSTGQSESALQLNSYKQGFARVRSRLLGVLLDQNSVIRQSAVESLQYALKLNDDSPQVIDALITGLKDQHPDVRLSAARSLGLWLWHLTGTKKNGISALDLLNKETSKKISLALINSLYDLNEDIRRNAITALQATESGEKLVLSTLARIIDKRGEKLELRESAIAMCWTSQLGLNCGNSRSLTSVLNKALADPSLAIRQSATIALHTELNSKTVIKILIEGLRSENPAIRLNAILGIQKLCPSQEEGVLLNYCSDLKAVIPLLLDRLNENIKPLRYAAALAIARIEPGQKTAVNILREISLEETDGDIKNQVSSALQSTEFEQIEKIEWLTYADKRARYSRPFANGSRLWDSADSTEFPLKVLKDENFRSLTALSSDTFVTRYRDEFTEADAAAVDSASAAEIRAAIRKKEKQVTATVSVLISMLNSQHSQQSSSLVLGNVLKLKNQDFRRSLVYSLGKIGEELHKGNKYPLVKKEINMALMTVLKDEKDDLDVRWIAATALQKIEANNVNWFFADNRLANPNNVQCQFPVIKTSSGNFITDRGLVFDIYSSQCMYENNIHMGNGLTEIYASLRTLLNRPKK